MEKDFVSEGVDIVRNAATIGSLLGATLYDRTKDTVKEFVAREVLKPLYRRMIKARTNYRRSRM